MKFIAAYLLAHLGGSVAEAASPSKDDVRRILESVGAMVEVDRLDLLFAELEGKDVAELIAAGRERHAYAPCACVGSAAPTGTVGAEAKEEEEKKKEKNVEEDDDEGMGLSLFDD